MLSGDELGNAIENSMSGISLGNSTLSSGNTRSITLEGSSPGISLVNGSLSGNGMYSGNTRASTLESKSPCISLGDSSLISGIMPSNTLGGGTFGNTPGNNAVRACSAATARTSQR